MDVILGIFGVLSGILEAIIPIMFLITSFHFWADAWDDNIFIAFLHFLYSGFMFIYTIITLSNLYSPIFSIINIIFYIILGAFYINKIIYYYPYNSKAVIAYKLLKDDDVIPFTYELIIISMYIINNIVFRFLYKYIVLGGFAEWFAEWMKIITAQHNLIS